MKTPAKKKTATKSPPITRSSLARACATLTARREAGLADVPPMGTADVDPAELAGPPEYWAEHTPELAAKLTMGSAVKLARGLTKPVPARGSNWTSETVDGAKVEDDGFGHVIVTPIKPDASACNCGSAGTVYRHAVDCPARGVVPVRSVSAERDITACGGPEMLALSREVIAAANAQGLNWELADLQVALRFRADGGIYWLANLGRTGADGASASESLTALRDYFRSVTIDVGV